MAEGSQPTRLNPFLGDASNDDDRLDLILILTAVMFLLHHLSYWYSSGPLKALMVAALLSRRMRRLPLLWLAAGGILATVAVKHWWEIDNHQYLYLYWCASLFFSLLLKPEARMRAIGINAALFLGLTMMLASVQKLLTPEYLDGTFFEYILLCDKRMEPVAWLVGGLDLDDLRENRATHYRMRTAGIAPALSELTTTARIKVLAPAMSWVLAVFEGIVGLVFLIPIRRRILDLFRATLMIVFVLGTYSVAPVVGFGWMVVILTLAQMPAEFVRMRKIFLVFFIILPIFKVPLGQLRELF